MLALVVKDAVLVVDVSVGVGLVVDVVELVVGMELVELVVVVLELGVVLVVVLVVELVVGIAVALELD